MDVIGQTMNTAAQATWAAASCTANDELINHNYQKSN